MAFWYSDTVWSAHLGRIDWPFGKLIAGGEAGCSGGHWGWPLAIGSSEAPVLVLDVQHVCAGGNRLSISPRRSVAGTSVKGTIQFGYLDEGNGGGAYDCREPVVVQRIRNIAWFVVVWIAKIGRIANH